MLPQARADRRGGERGAPGGPGAVCPGPDFGNGSSRFLARVAIGAGLLPQGLSPSVCIPLPLALVGDREGLEYTRGKELSGTPFPPA